MLLYFIMLMCVIGPLSFIAFQFWPELPIVLKIFWPIILAGVFVGFLVTTPLNGMFISKTGTLVFIPDVRFKKTNLKELERLAINFSEWENHKYSVSVKLVYKDGNTCTKNYARQFNTQQSIFRILSMTVYTLNAKKVNNICNKLMNLNISFITVVDKNGNIVYQHLPK